MKERIHVFEFMTKITYTVRPDTTLRELTRRLVELRVTGAPVVDAEGQLEGFVSLVDVAVDRFVGAPGQGERLVRDVMQLRIHTIGHAALLPAAIKALRQHRVHRLVVTDDGGHLVGMLSCLDLLPAIYEVVGMPDPLGM